MSKLVKTRPMEHSPSPAHQLLYQAGHAKSSPVALWAFNFPIHSLHLLILLVFLACSDSIDARVPSFIHSLIPFMYMSSFKRRRKNVVLLLCRTYYVHWSASHSMRWWGTDFRFPCSARWLRRRRRRRRDGRTDDDEGDLMDTCRKFPRWSSSQ